MVIDLESESTLTLVEKVRLSSEANMYFSVKYALSD